METFGAPGFDLRHFLYVQWLILTPGGWKDVILCSKICLPSAVRQSGGFSHGLTSQADLDQKKEELAFLTPLHTNVLLWLWNRSRLGGVWNTDGVYGIWELLIEQLSDRGRGLATPSKCKSIQSLFSSIWWMKSEFFFFLHFSFICIDLKQFRILLLFPQTAESRQTAII